MHSRLATGLDFGLGQAVTPYLASLIGGGWSPDPAVARLGMADHEASGASSFGLVFAGQNFLPLIRIGCGRMPASVHRSTVRIDTAFCSASLRVVRTAGRTVTDWLRIVFGIDTLRVVMA
jgi:hypothetical protein